MWPTVAKFVLMALLGWSGVELTQTGRNVATLTTVVADGKEARLEYQKRNSEEHQRIMDNMVPRKEYETEILGIKARIAVVEAKLLELEKERRK